MSTHFLQSCPICARPVRVGAELDGSMVACRHCRGTFRARSADAHASDESYGDGLLRRADRLLRMLSAPHPRVAAGSQSERRAQFLHR